MHEQNSFQRQCGCYGNSETKSQSVKCGRGAIKYFAKWEWEEITSASKLGQTLPSYATEEHYEFNSNSENLQTFLLYLAASSLPCFFPFHQASGMDI